MMSSSVKKSPSDNLDHTEVINGFKPAIDMKFETTSVSVVNIVDSESALNSINQINQAKNSYQVLSQSNYNINDTNSAINDQRNSSIVLNYKLNNASENVFPNVLSSLNKVTNSLVNVSSVTENLTCDDSRDLHNLVDNNHLPICIDNCINYTSVENINQQTIIGLNIDIVPEYNLTKDSNISSLNIDNLNPNNDYNIVNSLNMENLNSTKEYIQEMPVYSDKAASGAENYYNLSANDTGESKSILKSPLSEGELSLSDTEIRFFQKSIKVLSENEKDTERIPLLRNFSITSISSIETGTTDDATNYTLEHVTKINSEPVCNENNLTLNPANIKGAISDEKVEETQSEPRPEPKKLRRKKRKKKAINNRRNVQPKKSCNGLETENSKDEINPDTLAGMKLRSSAPVVSSEMNSNGFNTTLCESDCVLPYPTDFVSPVIILERKINEPSTLVSFTVNNIDYFPGDNVYIELPGVKSRRNPLLIAKIIHFTDNRKGVGIFIQRYSRPFNLTNGNCDNLTQDRRLECEKSGITSIPTHVINSRELYLSNATGIEDADCIRGRCDVEYYSDFSSACKNFKLSDDNFYWILKFNMDSKRLLDTSYNVLLTPYFQIMDLPEYIGDDPDKIELDRSKENAFTKSTLIWRPTDLVSDKEIDDYCTSSINLSKHTSKIEKCLIDFKNTKNCLSLPTHSYVHNSSKQFIYERICIDDIHLLSINILFKQRYNITNAFQIMKNIDLPKPIHEFWTFDEVKKFERMIKQYGKNFYKISFDSLLVSHKKSIKDIISYYYYWKKWNFAPSIIGTKVQRISNFKAQFKNNRTPRESDDQMSTSEQSGDETNKLCVDNNLHLFNHGGYYCRNCFTLKSRSWHHSGFDRKLFCLLCQTHFSKYSTLRIIDENEIRAAEALANAPISKLNRMEDGSTSSQPRRYLRPRKSRNHYNKKKTTRNTPQKQISLKTTPQNKYVKQCIKMNTETISEASDNDNLFIYSGSPISSGTSCSSMDLIIKHDNYRETAEFYRNSLKSILESLSIHDQLIICQNDQKMLDLFTENKTKLALDCDGCFQVKENEETNSMNGLFSKMSYHKRNCSKSVEYRNFRRRMSTKIANGSLVGDIYSNIDPYAEEANRLSNMENGDVSQSVCKNVHNTFENMSQHDLESTEKRFCFLKKLYDDTILKAKQSMTSDYDHQIDTTLKNSQPIFSPENVNNVIACVNNGKNLEISEDINSTYIPIHNIQKSEPNNVTYKLTEDEIRSNKFGIFIRTITYSDNVTCSRTDIKFKFKDNIKNTISSDSNKSNALVNLNIAKNSPSLEYKKLHSNTQSSNDIDFKAILTNIGLPYNSLNTAALKNHLIQIGNDQEKKQIIPNMNNFSNNSNDIPQEFITRPPLTAHYQQTSKIPCVDDTEFDNFKKNFLIQSGRGFQNNSSVSNSRLQANNNFNQYNQKSGNLYKTNNSMFGADINMNNRSSFQNDLKNRENDRLNFSKIDDTMSQYFQNLVETDRNISDKASEQRYKLMADYNNLHMNKSREINMNNSNHIGTEWKNLGFNGSSINSAAARFSNYPAFNNKEFELPGSDDMRQSLGAVSDIQLGQPSNMNNFKKNSQDAKDRHDGLKIQYQPPPAHSNVHNKYLPPNIHYSNLQNHQFKSPSIRQSRVQPQDDINSMQFHKSKPLIDTSQSNPTFKSSSFNPFIENMINRKNPKLQNTSYFQSIDNTNLDMPTDSLNNRYASNTLANLSYDTVNRVAPDLNFKSHNNINSRYSSNVQNPKVGPFGHYYTMNNDQIIEQPKQSMLDLPRQSVQKQACFPLPPYTEFTDQNSIAMQQPPQNFDPQMALRLRLAQFNDNSRSNYTRNNPSKLLQNSNLIQISPQHAKIDVLMNSMISNRNDFRSKQHSAISSLIGNAERPMSNFDISLLDPNIREAYLAAYERQLNNQRNKQ